jgi:hypothetical protein
MDTIAFEYINSIKKRFLYYKELGDKTFDQLSASDFHIKPNEESNSIAIIIQHISGNMLSRFTDFLQSDGEKDWRNRDIEFEIQTFTKVQLIEIWEKGWTCLMNTLNQLKEQDLLKVVYIRKEPHLVMDAINRQLAHYPYHIGQIIFIAKLLKNNQWITLSIKKNESDQFNQNMTLKFNS